MYVRSLPAAAKASQPPNPIVTRKDASLPPHKDGALILCSVRTVQQYCTSARQGRVQEVMDYIGRSLMVTWGGQ